MIVCNVHDPTAKVCVYHAYVRTYVCMCVYVCTCMHICMYKHVYMYVHTYIHVFFSVKGSSGSSGIC